MRDDVLKGLSENQRRKRIADDSAYLVRNASGAATEEAQAIAAQVGISLDVYKPATIKSKSDTAVIVCVRVDLDTPLYLADNQITRCRDCDCDVQIRPDVPAELVPLCICCAARRLREEKATA